jgi:hypothetical protein
MQAGLMPRAAALDAALIHYVLVAPAFVSKHPIKIVEVANIVQVQASFLLI